MVSLQSLPPIAEIMGWTLIHSLWQGALIAILVEIIRRRLPARASKSRYALAFSALNLLLLLAITTFIIQDWPDQGTALVSDDASGSTLLITESTTIHPVAASGFELQEWVPFLAPLWLLGYLLLLIRFFIGRFSLWGLRIQGTDILDPQWTNRFAHLSHRLAIRRRVRLMTSSFTSVPITFGWIKPVILLPIGMINHLDPQEVEAILIHELAHIQRQDYLWNTWQQCLECLFYYHPLTWWLTRQITDEREHLCDEITLQQDANALTYAKALLHIQEWHTLPRHAALAATGRKDALLHRIQRIIDHSVNPDTMQRKWIFPMLMTLPALAIALMAWIPSAEGNADLPADAPIELLRDSVPEKKVIRKEIHNDVQKIVEEKDGVREEATFENGKLTELNLNGKVIPPSQYEKHQELINRMSENMATLAPPNPPTPPTPPTPPGAPAAPVLENEEVMEWTSDEGGENKIIIRKRGPRQTDERRIKTIVIDGDDEPMIWIDKDDEGRSEKRIEIIREEEVGEGSAPNVFRFKSDGDGQRHKEIRIQRELAERDRARALDDRVIFFNDNKDNMERHLEVVMDASAPHLIKDFQFFGGQGGSVHERLTTKMLQEGLIQSRNEYKYDLSTKRLKIDGHRMPDAVHQRYLKLVESSTGKQMTSKDRYRADIDND
ncbi:MAG: M56 family metallopeptidase [Saprospiraceae bacterium]|nr:M56 family metallopeptidase [Saprospiraceae bacterium]